MSLVSVLTLQVAPAIAKSILRFWLQEREWAEDITSGVVDILNARTSDVMARQKGKRVFEEVGEKAIEALAPIFEFEGRDLSENSKIAIAERLTSVLTTTPIDTKLLAEQNLEPRTLLKYLLSFTDQDSNLFSYDEKELYHRVLSEACVCIVDISSQMPQFTQHTFGEVLKRQDKILDAVTDVLNEFQKIRAISREANPEFSHALFEKEYREAVVRNLDRLELFGIDVAQVNKRHRLSIAYITLSVRIQPRSISSLIQPNNLAQDVDGLSDQDTATVEEVLADSNKILVRGLAGSGKTTLLQWIAVNSARQTFDGNLANWNTTVPFFIRLRQLDDSTLPAPRDFPKLVSTAIGANPPNQWVEETLQTGRAIVLIDGVDEVPIKRRNIIRRWLIDLVNSYPNARYIITSRPSAVETNWLSQEGFLEAELLSMEVDDINSFVTHWYNAVKEELREQHDEDELKLYEDHLKTAIRKNSALRNLATNPLLCAMICALHRERRKQLPGDRIELYKAGCEMLLERRDKERGIENAGYIELGIRHKLVLLRELAYWLLENGWSMIANDKAVECFERRLPHLQSISHNITGQDVLKLLVDRSGLLREPVTGSVDFTHKTFQEYLAAQEALERGNTGVLIKNAHNDQWREVIILAAGLAKVAEREEIIKGLISQGDKGDMYEYQLYLLAVACLETTIELNPELRGEVGNRLAQIVPPKNVTEAGQLAVAGELAIPYLSQWNNRNGITVAACVRALSLIGGDDAFEVIKSYAKDSRKPVVNALLRAWNLFDEEIYGREVIRVNIAHNLEVRIIDQNTIQRVLPFLPELPELKVTVERITDVRDLAILSNNALITKLDLLGNVAINSLAFLENFRNLTYLGLSNTARIGDISPLKILSKLIYLSLWDCSQIADITPLTELVNLNNIVMYRAFRLNDESILPLLKLPKLRRVYSWGAQISVSTRELFSEHGVNLEL